LDLRCKNFDIIEEILLNIFKLNPKLSYKEVPFTFKKRLFGESKRNLLLFILTYIFTIFKLRLMI
jgi:dolichol-phosphate mannosyltransferase